MFKSLLWTIKASKNYRLYFIYNVLLKAIPFISIPFIVRYLSQEAYGLYVVYQSISQLVVPLFSIGVINILGVEWYKLRKHEYSSYLFTSICIVAIISIVFTIFSFLISSWISETIKFPGKWIGIILLTTLPHTIYSIRLNILRFENQVTKYGILSILYTIISYGTGIVLMLKTSLEWKSFVVGSLCGYLIVNIFDIRYLYRNDYLSTLFNRIYLKEIFKVGLPISLTALGGWGSTSINQLIINTIYGNISVAMYGAAMVFGSILSSIVEAIILAYVPYVYTKLTINTDLSKKQIVKTAYIIYTVIFFISILIALLGYFCMVYFMGNAYQPAVRYIAPVIIARLFAGYCQINSNLIMYVKKTKEMFMITIITTIVNILLFFVLIPMCGIMGVAISYAIVQIVAFLCYLLLCLKSLDLPWGNGIKIIIGNNI